MLEAVATTAAEHAQVYENPTDKPFVVMMASLTRSLPGNKSE